MSILLAGDGKKFLFCLVLLLASGGSSVPVGGDGVSVGGDGVPSGAGGTKLLMMVPDGRNVAVSYPMLIISNGIMKHKIAHRIKINKALTVLESALYYTWYNYYCYIVSNR